MLEFGSIPEVEASPRHELPQPVVLVEGNGVTCAMPPNANSGSANAGNRRLQ